MLTELGLIACSGRKLLVTSVFTKRQELWTVKCLCPCHRARPVCKLSCTNNDEHTCNNCFVG